MAPAPQRTAPEVVELPPEPAAIETLRVADVRQELRQAAHMLQDCGLAHSAAWAAEQLRGLRQEEGDQIGSTAPVGVPDQQASDALLLAKTYFDAKVCYHVCIRYSRYSVKYSCCSVPALSTCKMGCPA